jgi:Holliday junction resolvase-like predicted endonuclease
LGTPDYAEQLRGLLDTSEATVPLQSRADVENYFPAPELGTLVTAIGEELRTLLYGESDAGFGYTDVRRAIHQYRLEQALGTNATDFDFVLDKIAGYFHSGKHLIPLSDPAWPRIVLLGRALWRLEPHRSVYNRELNVTNAIKRLVAKGYDLRLNDGRIDRESPGLKKGTADVYALLAKVGLVRAVTMLFNAAQNIVPYNFEQFLFGRTSGQPWQMRDAMPPWGYLLNVLVQLPDAPSQPDAGAAWDEAIPLAIDLIAALDVETYDSYWMLGSPVPKVLPNLLGEIGLYDHFFRMPQWFRMLTPIVLRHIFTDEDDAVMRKKYGWTVRDAALFSFTVLMACKPAGTSLITRKQLGSTRLSTKQIDGLLASFSHIPGAINLGYESPAMAKKADLMFKPLIAVADDTYLVPCASVVGPAFYEALHRAVRDAVGDTKTNKLLGGGVERTTAELLRRRGLPPTRENAAYSSPDGADAGECDLVLEDDTNIVFVECKAKALTRGTMSGEGVEALVDYGASLLASQAQSLKHERVLVENGEIAFHDGYKLKLSGRAVTRLTITLLDHGTFQDRVIFSQFAYPMLSANIRYDPDHPRASTFDSVNEAIADLTQELIKSNDRGRDIWNSTMGAASLSVGQLAVLLNESKTVSELVRRLRSHFNFGSTNVLLEYHIAKKQGLFHEAPTPSSP